MNEHESSVSLGELALCIIVIVMMRGCYHVGVIAEKVNPEEYETKPLADPDPTSNGLYPLGSPFIGDVK